MRGTLVFTTAAVCLLASATAFADPAGDAFQQGLGHMQGGDYAAACADFQKSEELGGKTSGTRYQLGRCNEEQSRYVVAYRAFQDAEDLARDEPERLEVIRTRLEELESKVAFFSLEVSAPSEGLAIVVGGEAVPEGRWSKLVPVQPNSAVKVEASAPGRAPWSAEVQAPRAGQGKPVKIPALAEGDGDPGNGGANNLAVRVEGGPTQFKSAPLFWTGLGLVSGGVVSITIAGVAYATCEFCGDTPPGASVGLGVLGIALLGGGIPLMVIFGKRVPVEGGAADTPPQTTRIEPLIGPAYGGVRVTF